MAIVIKQKDKAKKEKGVVGGNAIDSRGWVAG